MKRPTRPTKPYKPTLPLKQFVSRKLITSYSASDDFDLAYILSIAPEGLALEDISFSLSKSYDYDGSCSAELYIYAKVNSTNENYDKELAEYQKKFDKYKEKYAKYKVDKEKYDRFVDEDNLRRLEKQIEHTKKKLARK